MRCFFLSLSAAFFLLLPSPTEAQWETVWTPSVPSLIWPLYPCGDALCAAVVYDSGQPGGVYAAILRSTDGATWETVHSVSSYAIGLTNFQRAGGRMFLAHYASQQSSVLVSDDDGRSWSRFSSDLRIRGMRRLDAIGSTLYAATADGVFKSDATNPLWQDVTGFPISQWGVTGLAASPDAVLAAPFGDGFGATGALYLSADEGETWSYQSLFEPVEHAAALVWTGSAFVASVNKSNLSFGNVYRSPDGRTWERTGSLDAYWTGFQIGQGQSEGDLFAHAVSPEGRQVWRSADDGESWSRIAAWPATQPGGEYAAGLATFDGYLYVSWGNALHRQPLDLLVSAEPAEATPHALALGPVAPNPTSGAARATLSGPPGTEATVHVLDTLGRIVRAERVRLSSIGQAVDLPSGLAPGLYLVRAEAGGEVVTQRFVVGR